MRVGKEDRWRQAQLVSGFWGPEHGDSAESAYQWTGPTALIRIPLTQGEPKQQPVEIAVGREPDWFRVPLRGAAFDVINNVGSELVDGSYGRDRGFMEIDRGQYDRPAEVFAWCGGAVLLSRRYLDDVGHFDDRLFLYYEDLDLAWRGRARGWSYRYVPESVVRHVHSASSDKASLLFAFYNERNRLLTLARNSSGRRVTSAAARSLLITASYARRDIVSPLLRCERSRWHAVIARLQAFGSFSRLLPATLLSRWSHCVWRWHRTACWRLWWRARGTNDDAANGS
jgi:hypothetical protein